VVLVSSLIDFRTVDSSPGNDISYVAYLPSFTAAAAYHGRIKGDPDRLLAEARDFAFGPYAAALLAGDSLPGDQRRKIAARYAALTGLPENLVLGSNLRVSPSRFRAELLRGKSRTLGRFDARVTRPTPTPASSRPNGDPSFDYAYGAFATAMLDYLRAPLNWTEDSPYEILTDKVNPWKGDGHENLSGDLADAMTTNPHLRLLVMCGATDLATPPAGIQYSLRHLALPPELRANIRVAHYRAGHMFYLNPPDLVKMRGDLVEFLKPVSAPAPVKAPATRESPRADATSESPGRPR
jgi:carboxypeptidase C (cathepsin A)